MLPTLNILGLELRTYSVVYAVALVIVGGYAYQRLLSEPAERPPQARGRDLLIVILCALSGTHLIGVIPSAIDSWRNGDLMWTGQANFAGTLSGGIVGGIIVTKGDWARLARTADLAGTPWPLLQAIGRLGCWSAGCCGGKPTDSPLAMYLRSNQGDWAWRYPTQLMSGLANLAIFGLLLMIERWGRRRSPGDRHWPFDGALFLIYLALFCFERFGMEWLRADAQPLLGPLSWVHLYTLAGLVAILFFYMRRWRREIMDEE